MLGLQVWMTMPVPCLVMVFREGTGHWIETLFLFPWLLLLETKWDFSESSVAQADELKAKLRQGPVILGSSCGKFYCTAFPSPSFLVLIFPFTNSLSSSLCPQLCCHQFLSLTSVWTMSSGAPLSSCTTHLSLIPLPKPARGSHLRDLGSNEYVHCHWYPSMGVSMIYPVPF